jgi:hypothetical protein
MNVQEAASGLAQELWVGDLKALVLRSHPQRERRGHRKGRDKTRLVRLDFRPATIRKFHAFADQLVRDLRAGSLAIETARKRVDSEGYAHCITIAMSSETLRLALAAFMQEGNNTFENFGNESGVADVRCWHEKGHAVVS